MAGKSAFEHGMMSLGTGLVDCMKSMEGRGSVSEVVKMVLSWSRLSLWCVSAAQDTMLVLMLVLVPSPSSCLEPSLVSRMLPPRSYTSLPLSLVLKLLGSHKWLWSLLLWSRLLVSLSHGVLSLISPSGLSWLFRGACVCSFVSGLASLIPMLELSACSCAWRLFVLAPVTSDGFSDVAAIDKGVGGRSSWTEDVGGGGSGKDSDGKGVARLDLGGFEWMAVGLCKLETWEAVTVAAVVLD